MQVFKFGGASIKDAESVRRVGTIIAQHKQAPLVVVISAMGKTTNALEEVVKAFASHDSAKAKELFGYVEVQHNALAQDLLSTNDAAKCIARLQDIYAEADWILHDSPVREYDYYYDQLVCLGELLSTTIIHYYLLSQKINNEWLDVRDVLKSDETWREGKLIEDECSRLVLSQVQPMLDKTGIVITQGFIACTTQNESITLGREGSDYTAAVLANILDAQSVSIWKDVKGILSGDPKLFEQVELVPQLSYYEAVEMTYYGAQVIHPKTIKPLQNKSIPLHVKCFLDASLPGTTIQEEVTQNYPPILVLKKEQVLLQVYSRDYSFITDDKLSEIYNTFHELNVHINLIQNAAISFLACIDNQANKIEKVYTALEANYKIKRNDNVELLTIRHYTPKAIAAHSSGKEIILEQKSRQTYQAILIAG